MDPKDKRIIMYGLGTAAPSPILDGSEFFVPLNLTRDGSLWSALSALDGGGSPTALTETNPTFDAYGPDFVFALDTASRLYGLNSVTGLYDRLRTLRDGSDAQPILDIGLLGQVARLQAFNGVAYDRVATGVDSADAVTPIVLGLLATMARGQQWNNATPSQAGTWDRVRGNTIAEVLSSLVRGATNSSADQINYNARGLHVVFDITAVPGVQTVTLSIEGKDPVSGKYYTLLTGAAEVGVATRIYRLYPGLTAVANTTVSDILPRTWRVTVAHSGAGNFTYSVGASLVN